MVLKISRDRPRLIRAVMESRDFELQRDPIREDLAAFSSFCLLVEACGQPLAIDPVREPFLIMLAALHDKYDHPRILRDLVALARDGAPI